jgi:molecular chaperone GrpE
MAEQDNLDPRQVPEAPETQSPDTAGEAAGVDLAARVAELEAQLRDVQLRSQAEIQNIQKRAEREADNARKFAVERFAGALIDVVDNLERALDSTPADNEATKALREGIVLTHKSLLDAL